MTSLSNLTFSERQVSICDQIDSFDYKSSDSISTISTVVAPTTSIDLIDTPTASATASATAVTTKRSRSTTKSEDNTIRSIPRIYDCDLQIAIDFMKSDNDYFSRAGMKRDDIKSGPKYKVFICLGCNNCWVKLVAIKVYIYIYIYIYI